MKPPEVITTTNKMMIFGNTEINSRNAVNEPKQYPMTEINNNRRLNRKADVSPYQDEGGDSIYDLTGGNTSH